MITLSMKGMRDLETFAKEFPAEVDTAAQRAVNYTLVKVRTQTTRDMQKQVELGKSYLDSKLRITRKATIKNPIGEISGAFEPISLARFARGTIKRGKPIKVRVKKGGSVTKFSNAAIVPLSRGGIGFLVRMKKGETLKGSSAARPLLPRKRKDGSRSDPATKAYLLYGPSVNQLFKEMLKTNEIIPVANDILEQEFFRQMKVLING